MEKAGIPFATVDEYIKLFPVQVQKLLKELRKTIRDAAPGVQEGIRYRMPAFFLNGNLLYFAAYKNHIGLYPLPKAVRAFKKELAAFKHAKGSVQFPLDQPLPLPLIRKIIQFRILENAAKVREKAAR